MTNTFAAALGLDVVERAQRRSAAYQHGLDDAIDGTPRRVEEYAEPILRARYTMGYGDGLAQLATYGPEENRHARR